MKIWIICALVSGGWREEVYSNCQGTCGGASKSKAKFCDNPAPSYRWVQGERQRTGDKCQCNSDSDTDSTEICDGLEATITKSCNDELCKQKYNRKDFEYYECFISMKLWSH